MTVRIATSRTRPVPADRTDGTEPSLGPIQHSTPGSARANGSSNTVLTRLIQAARDAASDEDLFLIMANETRMVAGAQQIFVFRHDPATRIVAISGMPRVNQQSPLVQDLERIVSILYEASELDEARMFSLGADADDVSAQLTSYPFRSLIWTPLDTGAGAAPVGILYTRTSPWQGEHLEVLSLCADIFAERLHLLVTPLRPAGRKGRIPLSATRKKAGLVAALLLFIGLCMPTTMSVNAPFQVLSKSHVVVSAPIQGVIDTVYVKPGDKVLEGQPLVKFVNIAQTNQVSIAQRQVDMSEAVLKRANQMSFETEEGRSQLGPSLAEVAIKRAELRLAQEQSSRTTINADATGIAVFSDEKSLIGRPFAIGERILEIANPDQVEFEILLDVSNSIALHIGAQVKLFPDSAPLQSFNATLTQLSYLAEPDQMGRLSHKLVATQEESSLEPLRLGTSGTARIYGHKVPLVFYLFRRPIAATRQWVGW